MRLCLVFEWSGDVAIGFDGRKKLCVSRGCGTDVDRRAWARRYELGIQAMKTYSAKPSEVDKKWLVIDADGLIVGRLAAFVASRLRGKHKPTFTPHVDCGDNIIVVNADKVVFTGNKYQDKMYYWHTGYIGGIKERTARNFLEGRFPERVVEKAVQRMMPGGPLTRRQLKNLRVYAGPTHPHEAQTPTPVDFRALNSKNAERA